MRTTALLMRLSASLTDSKGTNPSSSQTRMTRHPRTTTTAVAQRTSCYSQQIPPYGRQTQSPLSCGTLWQVTSGAALLLTPVH